MKDILLIGGAGNIGHKLISLLDENYSVTVLDLKSKLSEERLDKYSNQIKIVYGDVENYKLVESLVKKNDVVINLAGIMPPLANLSHKLANSINYDGTRNIVDAINKVNKSCLLIYPSFISVYGKTNDDKRNLKINTKREVLDYYSKTLVQCEEYIKKYAEKYIILRLPIVLTKNNYYIRHMKLNRVFDFITVDDLNNVINNLIKNKKAYNKIFNVGGFKANSTDFIKKLYKYNGKIHMAKRGYYFGEYDDLDKLNSLINVNHPTEKDYFKTLKKESGLLRRNFRKLFNIITFIYYKIKTK